jgi:hypothetical protein
MKSVRHDFDLRSKEIDEYFSFVKVMVSPRTQVTHADGTGDISAFYIDSELQKTLKATGFLLMYNLVESTMSNAIEAIISHMAGQSVSFDNLSKNIKIIILKNAKSWNPEKLEPGLKKIAHDIIHQTFKKEELFSGNLDARKIRETMKEYGVNCQFKVNGDCLLTIKTNRNNLAHGIVSFSDCGKDYDIDEIIRFKDDAIDYLKGVLDDIDAFLTNSDYIHK